MNGFDLAKDYSKGLISGWLETTRPGSVQQYLNLINPIKAQSFPIFAQYDLYRGKKTMLYQVTRKILGKDTVNYAQAIGDCVSFGAKNATEHLTCCDMLLRGVRETFKPVFTPYYYGTGRIYVGGQENDMQDGSLGSWMATAVTKYGTLFLDDKDVPPYSGNVAKQWGAKRAILDQYKSLAMPRPVKNTAQINSWQDLVVAISNGYPCPTASNVGYSMEASSDGFHRQTDNWGHQLCFIGVDDNDKDPYAIILNSWGDAHGHLKDFDNQEDLPMGVLRVRRKDAEKHIRAQETYAYSQFDGFPSNRIDQALLMMV